MTVNVLLWLAVSRHAVSLSAVQQLGALYQQPLTTCLHHHLVSAAVCQH